MKSSKNFVLAIALAAIAGFAAAPAHAMDVQYDYPNQHMIETRTVNTNHQLNAWCAPMAPAHIEEVIYFPTSSNKLTPESAAKVHHVAMMLKSPAFAGKHVSVNGYTDNAGKDATNQRLSYHRALAVRSALIAEGVPESMLSAQGSGKANPVASNATPEGRALNRRVTFTVVR